MLLLSPSLLSADLGMLSEETLRLQSAGIPWVHWDVMDGRYVPNITLGAGIIRSVRERAQEIFFDVHLMIEEPERHVDSFIEAGANLIVIHPEATRHQHRCVEHILSANILSGISLNQHQDPRMIEYLLPYIDVILIMGVNPGFSGQRFIETTIAKVEQLSQLITASCCDVRIEVDGGVSIDNIPQLYTAGAEIFVSGSSFFNGTQKTVEAYRKRYQEFEASCVMQK